MLRVHASLAMLYMAVLTACGDSGQPLSPPTEAAFSAITETTNQSVPISFITIVPCANGGAGEELLVEGTVHEVFRVTETPSGLLRFSLHHNFQGVTGTGLTTGDTYRAVENGNVHLHLAPGSTTTFELKFHLFGPGPDNNLTIHASSHVTITPNGDVTVDRSTFTVECD
jgi:hypothetical protein